ncbi:MAG: hypothetical protein ABJI00_01425, partial [Paracoccaceae bacterium]
WKMPIPPTGAAGSNVVFLCLLFVFAYFCFILCSSFAMTLCDFHFIFFLFLSPIDKPYRRSRVAWVDDEPALLVSYCLDAEGQRIVDERWTMVADRVARYRAGQQGDPGCATRTITCCRYMEDALCSVWFARYFPLVLSLTLLTATSGVLLFFLLFPARSFQVSARSPAGGARWFVVIYTRYVLVFFLVSFSLSNCLLF